MSRVPESRHATPIRTTFLPFSPPFIGEEEKAEILDTLESGWITKGPKTERFEHEFAAYVGAHHAVGLHSCTAALHLALAALGIGEGDEVITSTFTFASSAHVIQYVGATPVLVDCDPVTFNMLPEQVAAKITSRTRAIIPVHYGGWPCPMDEIHALATTHRLHVVEDAAHAAGTEYRGRKIGALSDVTCFSFYATKNMTTGEGGMCTTDNPDLAERIRVLSMYGISDARRIWQRYAPKGSWWYDIVELGYKYNMMDLQAALGIHQLRRLDAAIERRTHLAELYGQGFADMAEIVTPKVLPGGRHAWHLYPILLEPERLTIDRDTFIEELKQENIGTSVLYIPLHLHTHYRERFGYRPEEFPNAQRIYERLVNLPVSPKLTDTDLADVIGAVRKIVHRSRR